MSIMLYRHPGPHAIHGGKYDYVVVEKEDMPRYIENGWHKTTTAALAASQKASSKKTEPVSESDSKKDQPPEIDPEPEQPLRKYNQLSDAERDQIANDGGSMSSIAEKYNVSAYTVKKCKEEKQAHDEAIV